MSNDIASANCTCQISCNVGTTVQVSFAPGEIFTNMDNINPDMEK